MGLGIRNSETRFIYTSYIKNNCEYPVLGRIKPNQAGYFYLYTSIVLLQPEVSYCQAGTISYLLKSVILCPALKYIAGFLQTYFPNVAKWETQTQRWQKG